MNEPRDTAPQSEPGMPAREVGPPALDVTPVLERLGPSPFPRSGFPLIGFLATLYDHVAEQARKRQLDADKCGLCAAKEPGS